MKNISKYSLCISDLIMGFLFIFILLLMKFMLEYENKKEELLNPLAERTILLRDMKKKMEKEKIQVEIDEKNGVLKLKSLYYFAKGKYELSPKGKEDFERVKKIFRRLICYSNLKNSKTQKKWRAKYGESNFNKWVNYCNNSKKYKNKYGLIDSILIEGHADSTPIGRWLKFKCIGTNMDLAMKRSQTVFSFLTNYNETTLTSKEDGNYLYFLSNGQKKPLFGVASYGNLRRKQSITRDPASGGRDRRIDIRFIMVQSKGLKEELKNITMIKKEK